MRFLLARSVPSLIAAVGLVVLAGCTNYYQVTDTSNGKQYFTTQVNHKSGATMFKDGKTGNQLTIQNTEVKTIKKEEFDSGKVR